MSIRTVFPSRALKTTSVVMVLEAQFLMFDIFCVVTCNWYISPSYKMCISQRCSTPKKLQKKSNNLIILIKYDISSDQLIGNVQTVKNTMLFQQIILSITHAVKQHIGYMERLQSKRVCHIIVCNIIFLHFLFFIILSRHWKNQ